MKQDVRTIDPVDMRYHRIKAMRRHVLKPDMLLDALMQKLHAPPQAVSRDNLTWGGPEIIAGKILAATIRSVAPFRTHQLDLAHMVQVVRSVSDAKVHSLAFVPIRL